MPQSTQEPACWEMSKGIYFTHVRMLCAQVPAWLTLCRHWHPLHLSRDKIPMPGLQGWQLLWTASWHFSAVEELWQLPLLLPKVKLQSLMQGRAQQPPEQSGPQSPKGCNVQDTAHYKTSTRLSLEEPAAGFTPSLPQLCTDCLKSALGRARERQQVRSTSPCPQHS